MQASIKQVQQQNSSVVTMSGPKGGLMLVKNSILVELAGWKQR